MSDLGSGPENQRQQIRDIVSHINGYISRSRVNDATGKLGPGEAKSGMIVFKIVSFNELEDLTVT